MMNIIIEFEKYINFIRWNSWNSQISKEIWRTLNVIWIKIVKKVDNKYA